MPRMYPQPHAISMIIHKRWKKYTQASAVLSLGTEQKANPKDQRLAKFVCSTSRFIVFFSPSPFSLSKTKKKNWGVVLFSFQGGKYLKLHTWAKGIIAEASRRERTPIPAEMLVRCAKHTLSRSRYHARRRIDGTIDTRRLLNGPGADGGQVEYIGGQTGRDVRPFGSGLGWRKPSGVWNENGR